jgi:predicted nucleic acid-binding protein
VAEVIVDTCVWIDLSKGALDAEAMYNVAGSQLVHVSAISLGELEFGAQLPSDARERAQRTAFLRAIERMSVLAVTRETARSFGLLATMMKAAGRTRVRVITIFGSPLRLMNTTCRFSLATQMISAR